MIISDQRAAPDFNKLRSLFTSRLLWVCERVYQSPAPKLKAGINPLLLFQMLGGIWWAQKLHHICFGKMCFSCI